MSEGIVLPFLAAVDDCRIAGGFFAQSGSPAEVEAAAYSRPESVRTAYAQADVTLESARDHLEAVDLIVRLGQPSVAHWTCLRGLLEAASRSAWLFASGISAQVRVGRSLALRYETLTQQRKMLVAADEESAVASLDMTIDDAELVALSLGFPRLRNKKQRRDGIGQRTPSISDLVGTQYDFRRVYGILSGVAHADPSSIIGMGFHHVNAADSQARPVIGRKVNYQLLDLVVKQSLVLFVHPLWMRVIQYGLNRTQMAEILEDAFDKTGLPSNGVTRHWRKDLS